MYYLWMRFVCLAREHWICCTILRKTFVIQTLLLEIYKLLHLETLQLPPVPSAIDDEKYSFQSELWAATFPHQIILEESFRAKDDQDIVKLLNPFTTDGRFSGQAENVPFHPGPVKRPNKALDFKALDLVNQYLEGV